MVQLLCLLPYAFYLAGPTIMLLYPLYASICAMESASKLDDEQWLAYWIVYSFLTLFEMVAQPILEWIPIWYSTKLLFVSWLVLPQFRGASFLYERLVREQMHRYRREKNGRVQRKAKIKKPSLTSVSHAWQRKGT